MKGGVDLLGPGQRGPQMLHCRRQVAERSSHAAENQAHGALVGRVGVGDDVLMLVRQESGIQSGRIGLVTQPGADVRAVLRRCALHRSGQRPQWEACVLLSRIAFGSLAAALSGSLPGPPSAWPFSTSALIRLPILASTEDQYQ